ncbi:acylneuraminate cytidylyltransferase family protein [Anaerovorax odorimutans]|uniref:acylneuraminate cytidylyltransferase family protein n=1 Tax=Anaerovorax odorimutans TaxID=109327 RepID=UPI00040CAE74|nr:acylneuraminate cytidylyltransferase family protein [Anaerovorax odorimutans]
MIKKQNTIAIIPARAGSKGLPGKNIKSLCGKPLIDYTIEAAVKSKVFNKVVVSTDGEDIADISRKCGAEVPFLRPEKISQDDTKSIDVVEHCIDYYKDRGEVFDSVCLLQPTSPLRDYNNIKDAYSLFIEKKAISLISVCECEFSPLLCTTIDDNLQIGKIKALDYKNARRQNLPKYYRINGAIYLLNTEILLQTKEFIMKDSLAFIMNNENSIDIDNINDFLYAEFLIKKKNDEVKI